MSTQLGGDLLNVSGQAATIRGNLLNQATTRRIVRSSLLHVIVAMKTSRKWEYEQRIREIEHSSFTPLVLSATGGLVALQKAAGLNVVNQTGSVVFYY